MANKAIIHVFLLFYSLPNCTESHLAMQITENDLEMIINQLRNMDVVARRNAAEEIGRLGGTTKSKAIQLAKSLEDPDDLVRNSIISVFEKYDNECAERMIAALVNSKSSDDRYNIINGLGVMRKSFAKSNNESSVALIENELLKYARDKNSLIVHASMKALLYNEPRSIKALSIATNMVFDEKLDELVRTEALVGLEKSGGLAKSISPNLVSLLLKNESPKILREVLCRALITINPSDAKLKNALRKIMIDKKEDPDLRGESIIAFSLLSKSGEMITQDYINILKETEDSDNIEVIRLFHNTLYAMSFMSPKDEDLSLLIMIAKKHTSIDTRKNIIPVLRKAGVRAAIYSSEIAKMAYMAPNDEHKYIVLILDTLEKQGVAAKSAAPILRKLELNCDEMIRKNVRIAIISIDGE